MTVPKTKLKLGLKKKPVLPPSRPTTKKVRGAKKGEVRNPNGRPKVKEDTEVCSYRIGISDLELVCTNHGTFKQWIDIKLAELKEETKGEPHERG